MIRGMSQAIRVGLVGYGLAGMAFHAPLIDTTPGLHLDAIVTGNPERQGAGGRSHPPPGFPSKAHPLCTGGARRAHCAWLRSHTPTAVPFGSAAIPAGLATVVDKPFAPTAGEAR